MSLFRLARTNIQNYAAQRLKQFIWFATSTMVCFVIVSIQSNEMIVEKLQHIPLFVAFFYYVSIFLLFVCSFITHKMIKSFLKTRKRELQSHEGSDMEKRKMLCLLWQEQLLIFGGAGLFGLIHGMLFLKLCTIIFMKMARIHGVCNAPITISTLLVTTLFIIILIVVSMWQCYQFIQGLKKESSYREEKKA